MHHTAPSFNAVVSHEFYPCWDLRRLLPRLWLSDSMSEPTFWPYHAHSIGKEFSSIGNWPFSSLALVIQGSNYRPQSRLLYLRTLLWSCFAPPTSLVDLTLNQSSVLLASWFLMHKTAWGPITPSRGLHNVASDETMTLPQGSKCPAAFDHICGKFSQHLYLASSILARLHSIA